jgi:hypothetical protein
MADFYEIDFLDVETKSSGDAISLRYELNGYEFIHVVDGGYATTGPKLEASIRKYYGNPEFIDHVVATLNDGDHARGLISILENFEVGALWMLRPWVYAEELLPRFARYTNVDNLRRALREAYANLAALEDVAIRRGIPIHEPFQGTNIGAFTVMAPTVERFLDLVVSSDKTPAAMEDRAFSDALTALFEKVASAVNYVRAAWGAEAFPAEDTSNENEMSVVQYATLAGDKILLTGDTGRDGLREVIDYAPSVGLFLPGIDRFQVPHHGGRRNVNSELLNSLLGPVLDSADRGTHFQAFISSAKADEDHPRKVVVRAMIHRGGRVTTTEGKSFRTSSTLAPAREGWVTLPAEPYPEELED